MSLIKAFKFKVSHLSREKKMAHFYSLFKVGMTVLDVGVSAESKPGSPMRNYFLKTFRYAPKYYTGLGVQDLSGMEELFPGKRFVQYSGGKFPFENNEFDWVFSNAVIEHVGDDEAQLFFLNEMLRVAKNVYFTTPNKYFPVESHTNVFFLHWNNKVFYEWCRRYTTTWRKENLYLFSYDRLKRLVQCSTASKYAIKNNRVLGLPMTFTVTCSGRR
ncbi:MAG: class I SAM-dependent methyltransferase [Nitrospirota bacterium]|nr:class I SAM-dependent methyltransferase [Nitrospirota bacterium]